MKIITIANTKGSVAKSTMATVLGAGLAIRGNRVLVVDTDPQAHATIMLGSPKAPGLYDLLVRDAAFADTVRLVSPALYAPKPEGVQGSLYLMPGNKETRNIPGSIEDSFLLGKRLRTLEGEMDYVLVDTSPTPSLMNAVVHVNTDATIYPTHCEYLSLDGLSESLTDRLASQVERAQWGVAGIKVLGIVPVMYQDTFIHNQNLGALRETFGGAIWQPFPRRILWAEASQDGRLIFAYKHRSKAAKDGWRLVDEFEERVEAWLNTEQPVNQ